jgi:hypothetical protein
MTSKQRHWWQAVVILLGFYPVFAFLVIGEWHRHSHYVFPGLGYVLLGGIVSFLGLLFSGVILIFRHRTWWGLIALVFALCAFFVFLGFLNFGIELYASYEG